MDIENEYYIYRYFAEKSGKIENREGKTVELHEGDTYYIGKGKGKFGGITSIRIRKKKD